MILLLISKFLKHARLPPSPSLWIYVLSSKQTCVRKTRLTTKNHYLKRHESLSTPFFKIQFQFLPPNNHPWTPHAYTYNSDTHHQHDPTTSSRTFKNHAQLLFSTPTLEERHTTLNSTDPLTRHSYQTFTTHGFSQLPVGYSSAVRLIQGIDPFRNIF